MTRIFPAVYRTAPPTENPHDYIEEVSERVTTMGQLLFSVDDMPEWAPEGHAIFMAAGLGFGNSVRSFIENLTETRLECELGVSPIDAARLLQRGFAAAGIEANARIAASAVEHLSGNTLSPDDLEKPAGYVGDSSLLCDEMGRFLQKNLAYEIKESDWIRTHWRAAIDSIPQDIYWSRATPQRIQIGETFLSVMQGMDARLYGYDWPRYKGMLTGIPELKRGTSRLGGLLKSLDQIGDHAAVLVRRFETSRGELYEVAYRDAIDLRDPDGAVLERVSVSPDFYRPGTPGSLFWSADKAPDWRLEQIDGGDWVAAY